MECRACGMKSNATDRCEWCNKPLHPPQADTPHGASQQTVIMSPVSFSPPGDQTVQMPPVTTRRRVSLTGEVIEDVVTVQMPAQPGAPPGAIPATVWEPAAVDAQIKGILSVPRSERWEKGLAICLPLLAISMFLVHLNPGLLAVIGLLDIFSIPLILAACGAIPSFDDDMMDSSIMLLVCFFFGPVPSLIAYGILCLIRQDCNTAIIALLLTCIAVPRLLLCTVIRSPDFAQSFAIVGMFMWMAFFSVCVGFVGWLMSSFFKTGYDDF